MRVRKARVGDLDAIMHVMREHYGQELGFYPKGDVKAFRDVEARIKTDFKKKLRSRSSVTLLAFEGENLAGLVTGHTEREHFMFNHGKNGYIQHLHVRKGFRRGGVGALLMRDAERSLKKKGAEYIKLHVNAPNRRAKKLYKNMGFTEYFTSMMKKI